MMLSDTLLIAGAGMRAQGDRLRVVAENIANVDSTGRSAGEAPYRRKLVVFRNMMDKELGIDTVQIASRTYDQTEFPLKYMPNHPAANAQGYVRLPNVDTMMEMMDMREARRGYEANLGVVDATRSMLTRTLDIIR